MGSSSHAIDSSAPAGLSRRGAVAIQDLPRRLVPLWGMLLAGLLVISRRPDAVAHARFWAEDGNLFYADVYNRGLLATLAVPQSGYFQELPTLAAGIARLVPLALAPLLTNSIAIAVRVLPVGLLLSRRAEAISPDIAVRALLATLYIALPGTFESNANVDNALWYLAVAAVIVLMLRPPVRRAGRVLDLTILVLCGLTGVFSIALAPLAFAYRRWRGSAAVSRLTLVILTASAAIQLLALLVLQYHLPSGFGARQRVSVPLHPTATSLFRILGLRVIAEPLLGNSVVLSATAAVLLGVLGAVGALIALRRGTAELKLMVAFGAALFVMAIAHPWSVDWQELTVYPTGSRYFIIPQLAAVATLVWAIGATRIPWRLVLAGALVYMCLITIPRNWSYPPFRPTGFAREAALFEHERPGARMTFQLEPRGWSMTLVKR